jgi:glycosyltransferase involved in cell wall biosynthesis
MDKNVVFPKPTISIIVPVYNVEKYLKRCLDSIFMQQFSRSFEVIAIDDCSNDNSLNILNEYKKHENRLIILKHETNKKVSITRSTGINYATGEFVMFIDSDDCLLPNAFEKLIGKCVETEADVVVYNYSLFDKNKKTNVIKNIGNEIITNNKFEVYEHFFGALWNKIIKRALLENIVSGKVELGISEDLLYGTEILLKANKICLIPDSYYLYYINNNSLTNSVKLGSFLQNQVIVLRQIELIFEKYQIEIEIKHKLLNYFEQWIYLSLAKIHFLDNNDFINILDFLKQFKKSPIIPISRVKRLELAVNNKRKSLIEVYNRFGFKMALSIYIKSLFKK